MKYLANFTDEFGGKQYEPGDEVTGLDQATLDYLSANGKITVLEDGDPEVTAVGNAGDDADNSNGKVEKPEPGPLDGSIDDLTAHLETLNDADAIGALRTGEVAGKSRVGALAAIDARLAALKS